MAINGGGALNSVCNKGAQTNRNPTKKRKKKVVKVNELGYPNMSAEDKKGAQEEVAMNTVEKKWKRNIFIPQRGGKCEPSNRVCN